MKLNVISLALAAAVLGSSAAYAETLVVRTGPNGVVIKEQANPTVVVRKRVTVGSASSDCTTRTVKRTNEVTDRTVVKSTTRC